ncbi:MAG: class I SAM-dependent methyltransferase [Elusimicrobia bacterium]|nr:class I SAM-dependent methyltransferase [Elusimicrobiota bacterium]
MSADPLDVLAAACREWGVPLAADARERLAAYLRAVAARNETTNLTADASWEGLVLKHAADGALAAAVLKAALAPRGAPARPRILDLGSGGGFVGIALKIVWPEAEVTLMEAVERKFRFLSAAAAAVGLPGLRAVRRRAGDGAPLASYERDFDAVVERALAPLPEALALAAPLLKPGGLFAAFQSEEPDPSEPALARALSRAGCRVLESRAYRRPGEDRDRRLVIFARGEN